MIFWGWLFERGCPFFIVSLLFIYKKFMAAKKTNELRVLIKKIISENGLISERLILKDYDEYIKLVAEAYSLAPEYDSSAVKHWVALRDSNYKMWKKLISKVKVIFVTGNESDVGSFNILGKRYPIEYMEGGQPYETQPEMMRDFRENGILKINIDYSDHLIFSVIDNVVMRTVHDFIVHILGNKGFGGRGEIAAYNLHVRLAPREAVPALFTEVVGQVSFAIVKGGFPSQKIAVLEGFDYYNLGVVDDENYIIKDKLLMRKDDIDGVKKRKKPYKSDIDFKAISGSYEEKPEQ